ncbi:hypothetical protein [Rubritalea profundi]|uniref:hypothetical protein n=1 Tax=Rubritalea profundi TaxID=1658618 RepID=UPI0013FDB8EB|nr:hypothetical protein [Rubritalea profundi]
MEQLSLNLTISEINTILDALGQRPYVEVFPLVAKIKAQSKAQLQTRPGETGESEDDQ